MTVLEYRKSIIPGPKKVFVQADTSQIELRILAECSLDPVLLAAFDNDEDVHLVAASLVYNKPQEVITKEERYRCKKVGFGIIYGQTAFGLSPALGISENQAQALIDRYMRNFYHVEKWIDSIKAKVREEKLARTLGGRVRYFDNADSEMEYIVRGCERAGVNHVIQGTAADCMKESIIVLDGFIGQMVEIKLVGVFHDEILLEVDDEPYMIQVAKENLSAAIEQGHKKYIKRVPIVAEPKVLKHWGEAK